MTRLRPTRSEIFAAGTTEAHVPRATRPTNGMNTIPVSSLIQSHASAPGRTARAGSAREPPIRIASREPTNHRKLLSRRTSVPHASAAIERHGRPPRDLGAGPSRTRMTTDSIVASSSTPSVTRPIAY